MAADAQKGAPAKGATADGSPATIHGFVWARAAGAVAVVVLHAFITAQVAGGYDELGTTRLLVESCLSIPLTRWAVPVFFMMSGALMLDPQREMGWPKVGRHIWRLVFVLITFGLAFSLVENVVDAGGLSLAVVGEALLDVACARSWDHLWFVYTLVGFYLLTPLLRAYIAQAGRRELFWVMVFMVCSLQGANSLRTLCGSDLWQVVRLPLNLTWFVLGHYAHTYLRFDWRHGLAALASVAAMVWMRIAQDAYWVTAPEHVFVVPLALAAFLAFERFCQRPADGYPLVALLADYSFGIYLVHPIFQHAMVAVVDVAAYPAWMTDAALALVPIPLSVGLVWLLRKIPGFADKV